MSIFEGSKLLINQLLIFVILLFTAFENLWESEPVMVMLVSSAKGIGLDVSEMDFGRSLMYNKKKAGDRVWSYVEHHH